MLIEAGLPNRANSLSLNAFGGPLTLNGDLYTYSPVKIHGSGEVKSNGAITFHNTTLTYAFGGAGNETTATWTCLSFTGAGATGVTIDINYFAIDPPAQSTTWKLVKTTGGANSVSGTIAKGKYNGQAYPAAWRVGAANDMKDIDLTYTKP